MSSRSSRPQAGQHLQAAAAVPRLCAEGAREAACPLRRKPSCSLPCPFSPLQMSWHSMAWHLPWHGTVEATPIAQFYSRPPGHTLCGFRAGSVNMGINGSAVKNLPARQEPQETWVRSLGQEDPLEEGMATHSSILAWRTPWTEEPGGLQSMGSHRVGHS